jgi:hypothetical protein
MDTKKKLGYGLKIKSFLRSELPPHVLIAHKALLLYILITYKRLLFNPFDGFPFLPFISFLDAIPSVIFSGLIFILFGSIFASLLKIANYRLVSLISGSIIIILILSSKTLFSNSLTFAACLLILIGLYRKKDYLFRIQIALLYIGASTNKMIDPDWWNGNYFDFFFRNIFDVTLYKSMVPENSLAVAQIFGIATIFTELLLGIAVLIPKITRLTIVMGMFFHASMLIITSGQLSNHFFYIMAAAFLLISRIHIKPYYLSYKFGFLPKLIGYFDPSDSTISENKRSENFTLRIEDSMYAGFKSILKIVLSKQVVISSFFILFMLQMRTGFMVSHILRPILSLGERLM